MYVRLGDWVGLGWVGVGVGVIIEVVRWSGTQNGRGNQRKSEKRKGK